MCTLEIRLVATELQHMVRERVNTDNIKVHFEIFLIFQLRFLRFSDANCGFNSGIFHELCHYIWGEGSFQKTLIVK